MIEIVRGQAADLARPPLAFEDVLASLERLVPGFAGAIRDHVASMETRTIDERPARGGGVPSSE